MKFLFTLIISWIALTGLYSQNLNFDRQLILTQRLYEEEKYAETLIAASDLILEDLNRMEGFYLSSLVYIELGDLDKAEYYLNKAASKSSDSQIIEKTSAKIKSRKEYNRLLKEGDQQKIAGNYQIAAASYFNAWKNAPDLDISVALESVSLLISQNKMLEARSKLDTMLKLAPPEYQAKIIKLKNSIEKTAEVVNQDGYDKYKGFGDEYFERSNYQQALVSYEKAMEYIPNDLYASTQKRKTMEEIAWKKALDSAFVENTESYADTYPNGKYIEKANALIRRIYISKVESAFKESNEEQLVKFHNKFLRRFPSDDRLTKNRNLLLEFYLAKGNTNMEAKNWLIAKNYFQAYFDLSPEGEFSDHCRKSIRKCDWQINQKSARYLMYTFDYQSPIGISIGKNDKNRAGFYLNLKMNSEIFTGWEVAYKIDNQGKSDSPWDVAPTGKTKNANICLSGGVSFKIIYPLWGYLGGGIGYLPQYDEVNEYDNKGILYETVWMRNTDKTTFGLFPEGGIKLKISKAFVLKYGIMYHKGLINQFGFGFQI